MRLFILMYRSLEVLCVISLSLPVDSEKTNHIFRKIKAFSSKDYNRFYQ